MLYRKAGLPDKARELFRKFPQPIIAERGFYYEWANAEGNCGDHVASAILAAFSVSDDCPTSRVENDRAKLSLGGMGLAFRELFTAHREVAFRDARISVAVLGQQLNLDSTSVGYFQTHLQEAKADGAKVPSVEESFHLLHQGVVTAKAIGLNSAVSAVVPDAAHLNFDGLKRLVYASMEAKQQRR